MDLSEKYFKKYGLPMLENKYSFEEYPMAIGLVGEGSECFGFDDEISRDHDFGPGFCIWLKKEDYKKIGEKLQDEYNKLPKNYAGFDGRKETKEAGKRVGVFEISQFYQKFTGLEYPPSSLREWLAIPESYLATVTNGKVFMDANGEFTKIRNYLLNFYPEDIRMKKLAARCANMAQSGQYNFNRCYKRKELVAAHYAEAQFIEASISSIFLLNKRYKPFYKWMHKSLESLPILGTKVYSLIFELVSIPNEEGWLRKYKKKAIIIEEICRLVSLELQEQKLCHSESNFMLDYAYVIQSKISEPNIKKLPISFG